MTWHEVCRVEQVPAAGGVAALVGERPVAVFRSAAGELFALGNVDPFSGAGVISHGIVGDRDGEPTVSSPLHKHVFSLRTGVCLDRPETGLPVHIVRRRGDVVEIHLAP